jgi:DNA replicative helicase MCM subunit Mcm2 (Cdc46/Mcm family)
MEFVQRFGTGNVCNHVTTVEHVEQVVKHGTHKSKKEKIEQIIQIIKDKEYSRCRQEDIFEELSKRKSDISKEELKDFLGNLRHEGAIMLSLGEYRAV